MIKEFWKQLSRRGRFGIVAGLVCILAFSVGAGYWLLRTDYQVLFSGLAPQDASAVTAELERQKIPYAVGEQDAEGGTAVLVDGRDVYKTRLKIMGKELPLHGVVGFELFNNSDFGMTEFAQRINYQRALQGELTRTILALSEIRDARVLLALPEQGLFKQARNKATASITLTLKPGRALVPAQVVGIQRLVAAAVAGVAAQDVTVVDQSGVTLSRAAGDGQTEGSGAPLDFKREMEQYLSRKADEILERALGPGQALASVDVTLDMDRVQTTTEDVVTAPGAGGRSTSGVIVRERETTRQVSPPLGGQSNVEGASGAGGENSQREVEYAVGRRVANVISQPGSIRRIHVVAVVMRGLDAAQQEQLRKTVAASVGAEAERGDTVVVQTMQETIARRASGVEDADAALRRPPDDAGDEPSEAATVASSRVDPMMIGRWLMSSPRGQTAVGGLMAMIALGLWLLRRRRPVSPPGASRPLSEAERQAALAQVTAWMREGERKRPAGGMN